MMMLERSRMFSWATVTVFVALCIYAVQGEDKTVTELFTSDPKPSLAKPITLSCAEDGEKIKIIDIAYVVSGCRSVTVKPEHPAAEDNRKHIVECTGKRTCTVLSNELKPPYLPRRSGCLTAQAYQIKIVYTCVPQDKIHSMCSGFISQEYGGYLSTPHYPESLSAGVPIAPCQCELEASLNSRIILTLLEASLASNTSDLDPNNCQVEQEHQKQFLQIGYNHGMAEVPLLCTHRYNFQVQPSSTYSLHFENPVKRKAGALWMQYSAEDRNALVTVRCVEPAVTTIAPIYYTGNGNGIQQGKFDHKLILGILMGIISLIVIIIIVMIIRYRRRLNHFMVYKYHKRSPKPKVKRSGLQKNTGESSAPYSDVQFDAITDAYDSGSYGKPTAHIPPHQSFSEERLEIEQDEKLKGKKCNGKVHYSTFKSSYLPKKDGAHSDSDRMSNSSRTRRERATGSGPSSPESSQPSTSQRDTEQTSDREATTPTPPPPPPILPTALDYDEIWMRADGSNDSPSIRSNASSHDPQPEEPMSLPLIHINSMQFVDDNRPHPSPSPITEEEEDEMDIKPVNPRMVPISPFRVRQTTSATHSPTVDVRSKRQPGSRSSMSLDSAGRYGKKTPSVTAPISSFSHPSKLLVDMSGPRKSRSLAGHTRTRHASVPAVLDNENLYARIHKSPGRKASAPHIQNAVQQREVAQLADHVYNALQTHIATRARPRPPVLPRRTSPNTRTNLANGHTPRERHHNGDYAMRIDKEFDLPPPP